jgi:uncharacterized protein YeeX (DUF496 family)
MEIIEEQLRKILAEMESFNDSDYHKRADDLIVVMLDLLAADLPAEQRELVSRITRAYDDLAKLYA